MLSDKPKRDTESPIDIAPEIHIAEAVESPQKPVCLEIVDKPISPEKSISAKDEENEFESLNSEEPTYEFRPIIASASASPES